MMYINLLSANSLWDYYLKEFYTKIIKFLWLWHNFIITSLLRVQMIRQWLCNTKIFPKCDIQYIILSMPKKKIINPFINSIFFKKNLSIFWKKNALMFLHFMPRKEHFCISRPKITSSCYFLDPNHPTWLCMTKHFFLWLKCNKKLVIQY